MDLKTAALAVKNARRLLGAAKTIQETKEAETILKRAINRFNRIEVKERYSKYTGWEKQVRLFIWNGDTPRR